MTGILRDNLTKSISSFLTVSAIIGASAALAPPSIADELTTAPADIRLIADELTTAPVPAEDEPAVVRNIVFPVAGEPSFWDDWHAPRDNGERLHLGNDIAAPKLTPALAAVDGRVSRLSSDSEGRAGNYLVITDGEGWEYVYIHLNNDSPDTDNNIKPQRWAIAPGIDVGTDVRAGRVIGFVGDSGNAETTEPHLHFEIRDPEGNHVDPHASLVKAWSDVGSRRCLRPSTAANMPSVPNSHPRLVVAATGQVVSLDGALHFGDLLTFELDAPIVAATLTRSGRGYWLLGADGGVFSFGDAAFHGSLRSFEGDPLNLLGPPESLEFDGEIRAVDIVATADGSGYWIVLASGTAIEFGGELRTLSPPVELISRAVGLFGVPSGQGMWLLSEDGDIFALAGAEYLGSLPAIGIAEAPAVAMLVTQSDHGYAIVDELGSVFGFGDFIGHGEYNASENCSPTAVSAAVMVGPSGHQVLTSDGRVTGIGDIGSPLDDIGLADAVDMLTPRWP